MVFFFFKLDLLLSLLRCKLFQKQPQLLQGILFHHKTMRPYIRYWFEWNWLTLVVACFWKAAWFLATQQYADKRYAGREMVGLVAVLLCFIPLTNSQLSSLSQKIKKNGISQRNSVVWWLWVTSSFYSQCISNHTIFFWWNSGFVYFGSTLQSILWQDF